MSGENLSKSSSWEISNDSATQNNSLLYFLPACGVAISLLYFVTFMFRLGYFYGAITNLVFALIYLLTFVFYRVGRVYLGKHFLALSFITQVSLHATYLFPREAYFQLYFLVAIPLVFMVFDASEKISRLVYCCSVIVLLLSIQLGSDFMLRPFNFIEADILMARNYNLICSFLVLSVSAFIYVHLKEKREYESRALATTDALTGLNNRRNFYSLAHQQFRICKRSSAPLSILYIDIDYFKQINDQYGHKAGDEALKSIAETIRKRSRESDVLARIGGDEFLLLLANTDEHAAARLAEQILQSISIAYAAQRSRNLSVSIGVAQLQTEDVSIENLLHRADKALYRAKKKGRNRVESWQPA